MGGPSMALMAAGVGLQAVGQVRAAGAEAQAAKANASLAEMEGAEEMVAATARAEARTREARRIMSRQRVIMAESAADPGSGSLAALQAETAEQSTLDALAELYGGRKARSARRSQAAGYRVEGRSSRQAGYLGVGASILQGAGNVLDYRRKTSGR